MMVVYVRGTRVMVVSSEGGTPDALRISGGGLSDPVWSPDGSAVAVIVNRGGDEISLVSLDGGNETIEIPEFDDLDGLTWR
jgi:Tol biopolymer transport system component